MGGADVKSTVPHRWAVVGADQALPFHGWDYHTSSIIIEEKKRGRSTKTKNYEGRQGEAAQPSSSEASAVD